MRITTALVMLLLLAPAVLGIKEVTDQSTISSPQNIEYEGTYYTRLSGNHVQGYLVEFNEEPSIERNTLLKIQGKSGTQIAKETKEYENKLEALRNDFLEEAKISLGKSAVERGSSPSLRDSLKVLGEYSKAFNGVALDITPTEAAELNRMDAIKQIWPNYELQILLSDSIPIINADDVWGLNEFGTSCMAGENCLTGHGVVIAIIDSGVDYLHPDLGGCIGPSCKVIGGYDSLNNDDDPMDDNGHGTHVAATAAGKGALYGVAPDAKILAYKVCTSTGSCPTSALIEGIERALDPNNDGDFSDRADVISMSIGGGGTPDDPKSQAVDNAVALGSIVVVAAGNDGPNEETITCPGCAREALTVAASIKFGGGNIASFSSRGPVIWQDEHGDEQTLVKPDVNAPGVSICAAQWNGYFDKLHCLDDEHISISGTSMAAPHVAGGVALLRQKYPEWTPQEIKTVLRNTATDTAQDIFSEGYGRVDLLEAINSPRLPVADLQNAGTASGSTLQIRGSAYGEGFTQYKIYHRKVGTSQWIQIGEGTSPIIDGALGSWYIGNIGSGTYDLRLNVVGEEESVAYGQVIIENVIITQPKDLTRRNPSTAGQVFSTRNDAITVEGKVKLDNLQKYTIEWCKGIKCSTEGITLTNGGAVNTEGILGTWKLAGIEETGLYTLHLIATLVDGTTFLYTATTYLDSRIMRGWPVELFPETPPGTFTLGLLDQPVLADLNSDGTKELIIAYDRDLIVLDYRGRPLPGWPQQPPTSCSSPFQTPVSVADIDDDEKVEIILRTNCGHVFVYEVDGALQNSVSISPIGQSIVSIADLDSDGRLELISASVHNSRTTLHVLDNELNIRSGWPKFFGDSNGLVSVGDVDGDRDQEIIFSDDTSVYVLHHDGTSLQGWPQLISGSPGSNLIRFSTSIGDLDKSGTPEIMARVRDRLYGFGSTGELLPGWPYEFPLGSSLDTISIADLDNNGEAVITFTEGVCLQVLNHEVEERVGFPACPQFSDPTSELLNSFDGNVIVANLDNDETEELLAARNGGIVVFPEEGFLRRFFALNNDGTVADGFPLLLDAITLSDTVSAADIDNDGDNEIALVTFSGKIYVYDLDAPVGGQWPKYRHNLLYTGNADWKDPLPSAILNPGPLPIIGYLTLKIEEYQNSVWEDHLILENMTRQRLHPNSTLLLAPLWNKQNIYLEPGRYRAVAKLTDGAGNILQAAEGELRSTSQFEVREMAPLPEDHQVTGGDEDQEEPVTDGEFIAWLDFTERDGNVVMCDLSLNGAAGGCQLEDQKILVTNDELGHDDVDISEGILVWAEEDDAENIKTCDYRLNGLAGGCLLSDQKEFVTNDNNDQDKPVISGNLIVWRGREGSQRDLFYCDRSLNGNLGGCLSSDEKVRITHTPAFESFHRVSDSVIVWQSDSDLFMCDIEQNGNYGGCLETDDKIQVTDDTLFQSRVDVSGSILVWSQSDAGNQEVFYCDLTLNGMAGGCLAADEKIRVTQGALAFSAKASEDTLVWSDSNAGGHLFICRISLSGEPGGCLVDDAKIQISQEAVPVQQFDIFADIITGQVADQMSDNIYYYTIH